MKLINILLIHAAIIVLSIVTHKVSYASGEHTFKAKIVNAETGLPLAATVSVKNGDGNVINLIGEHEFVYYLEKKRWYVNGEFSLITDEDSLIIEIRNGFETYPIIETVYLSKAKTTIREFKLKRWVNLEKKDFFSGDTHVHFLDTKSAHLQMQAEDLHVVNLLTSDFTNDRKKFTGALDGESTPDHLVYVGQEIRDWQLGHANLLGLKTIVEPFAPFGGFLSFMGSNPNLLLSPRLQEARDQDAAIVWAHFSNLPGLESAIAIPLRLIDAIEIVTYSDPTKLPDHWVPWEYSNMSQAEFTVMRGMDLYYQYLNAGFKLPITAGTDKMGNDIPVGSNRHYVRINGEPNYKNWNESLKAGKGFVTNGPIIEFSVDNHMSGESINFEGEKTVTVRVEAKSLLPFKKLEIVVNGKVISWKELPDYWKEQDLYMLEIEKEITISSSTWIVGRATSVNTPMMLPRGLTVFAHTNPIYYLKNEMPVYVQVSIDYLKTYQKAVRNWIEHYSDFSTEAEREEAGKYLDKAEKVLLELNH